MKRFAAVLMALFGAGLLAMALRRGADLASAATGWGQAEGEVVSSDIARSHDAEGRLQFRTRATFRFTVDGREYTASGESDEATTDYGALRARAGEYAAGKRHRVRYRKSNPLEIRFGAAGFRAIAETAGIGLLAAGCALLARRLWRSGGGRVMCANCRHPVNRDWRYCPICGESREASGHPIAHGQPG